MSQLLQGTLDVGAPLEVEVEPTFTLRGQDVFAPFAVREYASMLRAYAAGAAEDEDLAAVVREKAHGCEVIASEMIAWQSQNPARVKVPD
jgi:hypothetical protein